MGALRVAQRIGLRDADLHGAARDDVEELARRRLELGARADVVAERRAREEQRALLREHARIERSAPGPTTCRT